MSNKEISHLKQKINFLEDIIAKMPGHIYWLDKNNVFLGCNDLQAKSAGLASRHDIIGKRNKDLPWNKHTGDESSALEKVNNIVMRRGKAISIEEPHSLKDGNKKIFISKKQPLYDEKGKIIGILGISFDITERKKKEHELIAAKKRAEKAERAIAKLAQEITGAKINKKKGTEEYAQNIRDFYENIISKIPAHIFWTDTNNVFLGCNDAQAKDAGLKSRKDIIGKTNYDMPWKKQAETLNNLNNKVMLTGRSYIEEELSNMSDGRMATFLSEKTPLRDKHGNITGVLGISVDITDRKKMEEDLAQAKERLRIADLEKLNLLSVINHESRNPLHVILGMAQILRNKDAENFNSVETCTKTFHEGLQNILDSGTKLMDVINYLYDFVEQEVSAKELPQDEMELPTVLDWLVKKYDDAVQRKGLRVKINYQNTVPNKIELNSRRFLHILDALISNAVKYTEHGSINIKVSSKQLKDDKYNLSISVKDTGRGMRPEQAKHIFDHFSEPEREEKSYMQSGLVLSATKQRLKMLGGNIDIKSKPNVGTEVWFNVPVIAKTDTRKKAKDLKVLIIEDDRLSAKVLAEMLTGLSCTVDIVANAGKAKNILKKTGQYDVVFVDLLLPDMYGYDLVPFIRKNLKNGKNIPIIAVTAQVSEEDKDRCLEAGMNDVLFKPVYISDLKDTLEEYAY
jgi:PAS domain S-box-containing protein